MGNCQTMCGCNDQQQIGPLKLTQETDKTDDSQTKNKNKENLRPITKHNEKKTRTMKAKDYESDQCESDTSSRYSKGSNSNTSFLRQFETCQSEKEIIDQIEKQIQELDDQFILSYEKSRSLINSTKNASQLKLLPYLTYEDEQKYYGQWRNCQREGFGICIWQDAHGKGKLYHVDGDIYEGEFRDDKAEGEGEYKHLNGAKYFGQWIDDKQHGKGKELWPDGAKYEGAYENGKKHGQGALYFSDGSWYQGEFIENNIQGYGMYCWPDQRKYIGQWEENKMNGWGKTIWPDGRIYEGGYLEDKKSGFGKFTWPNGREYTGEWKNGKQEGKGKYINEFGQIKEGLWTNGKFVS